MSKSLNNQVNIDMYRLDSIFNKINNHMDSYVIKDKIINIVAI